MDSENGIWDIPFETTALLLLYYSAMEWCVCRLLHIDASR